MGTNRSETEIAAEEFISAAMPKTKGLPSGIRVSLLRGRELKRNEPDGLHFDVNADWPQLIEAFKILVPSALTVAKFVLEERIKGTKDSAEVREMLLQQHDVSPILDKISKKEQVTLIKAIIERE